MNHKDNIKYRKDHMKKVFSSNKLTDLEKWRSFSNPIFNEKVEFPCYKRDVLCIPQNKETIVTLTVLKSFDGENKYNPLISVVGDGIITVKNGLFKHNGEKINGKETRILIPLFNEERNSISFSVISKAGLISIAYQCEYYDNRMKLYKSEISDGPNLAYGMKKHINSENNVIYCCKNPKASFNEFNDFEFSIEISN